MNASSIQSPIPSVSVAPALVLSNSRRLFLIAANYIPFMNLLIATAILFLSAHGTWPRWTWIFAPAWLLLAPPLIVRLVLFLRPLPPTDIPITSPAFLIWWFTSQWQAIFNRLPFIEETIRLVPGLYGVWLRLWGAKVGRFVYWTPGLRLLDRPLVNIGDRVIFGAGVRINPHILMPNDSGNIVLRAAVVRIGADALVGGYSLLLAGCWIGPGEASPGQRTMRPFTGWENGRRVEAAHSWENENA